MKIDKLRQQTSVMLNRLWNIFTIAWYAALLVVGFLAILSRLASSTSIESTLNYFGSQTWNMFCQPMFSALPNNIFGVILGFILMMSLVFLPHALLIYWKIIIEIVLWSLPISISSKIRTEIDEDDETPLPPKKSQMFFLNKKLIIDNEAVATQVIRAGKLSVPDGKVFVGDGCIKLNPLKQSVVPGKYEVEISKCIFAQDVRFAFMKLKLSKNKITKYIKANFETTPLDSTIAVDSGTVGIAGTKASRQVHNEIKDDYNGYLKKLNLEKDGWTRYIGNEGEAVICESGYGDGLYQVYTGVDEYGKAVEVLIDFGLFSKASKIYLPN